MSLPLFEVRSPGTFSRRTHSGPNDSTRLRNENARTERSPVNPLRFPAELKSWHGNPADHRVAFCHASPVRSVLMDVMSPRFFKCGHLAARTADWYPAFSHIATVVHPADSSPRSMPPTPLNVEKWLRLFASLGLFGLLIIREFSTLLRDVPCLA